MSRTAVREELFSTALLPRQPERRDTPARRHADRGASYTPVAAIYEALAHFYSAGRIVAAKRAQLDELRPGDRVLYAGVGAGEDAVEAARLGARLTCLDVSAEMLARLQARLARASLSAEIIRGNAFDHDRPGHYDVVVANFFLNCFREPAMRDMLAHLARLVRPGGKLLIADLAVPQGNAAFRSCQRLYSRAANWAFWALGLAPWHANYDYRCLFPPCGLEHVGTRSFRLFGIGPIAFETLTARRMRSEE